jgi:hypothetical protein
VQRPERGGRCGAETVVLIPPYARQSYSDRRFPTVTSTCKAGSKFYQTMRAETMMLCSVGRSSACVGLHQVEKARVSGRQEGIAQRRPAMWVLPLDSQILSAHDVRAREV